jgi:predicted nucleic acid-binding protein
LIHLDTSFMVDLLRETGRGVRGPAIAFLDSDRAEDLWISLPVQCELLAGAELSPSPARERSRVERLCDGVRIAMPDQRFAPAYARLLAGLRRRGLSIGVMDLLIATAAVVQQAPLVTRNTRDFQRIADLELLSY